MDFCDCLFLRESRHFYLCNCILGFGGSVDLAAILDFVDSGHDLIMSADVSASDLIREIATECGVEFDEVRRSSNAPFFWVNMVSLVNLECMII